MTKIGDNSLFTDEIRYLRRALQYEAKCGELNGGIHQFLQERVKTGEKSYCDHKQGTTSDYPFEQVLHWHGTYRFSM